MPYFEMLYKLIRIDPKKKQKLLDVIQSKYPLKSSFSFECQCV